MSELPAARILAELGYWEAVLPEPQAAALEGDFEALMAALDLGIVEGLPALREACEALWHEADRAGDWQLAAAWCDISGAVHEAWVRLGPQPNLA